MRLLRKLYALLLGSLRFAPAPLTFNVSHAAVPEVCPGGFALCGAGAPLAAQPVACGPCWRYPALWQPVGGPVIRLGTTVLPNISFQPTAFGGV